MHPAIAAMQILSFDELLEGSYCNSVEVGGSLVAGKKCLLNRKIDQPYVVEQMIFFVATAAPSVAKCGKYAV